MFERFTREAREVVETAQSVARTTGSSAIDSRHLLVALIERDAGASADLRAVGMRPEMLARSLRSALSAGLDAAALASVGIDLDAVRERADAVFGEGALDRGSRSSAKGHIRFAPDAKKALELSLREAIRLRLNRIDGRMLLLGLLRDSGSRAETALRHALAHTGSSVEALRAVVEQSDAAAS
jgi:ATP-dependent Clp protease ATP-binding subunit ClpA